MSVISPVFHTSYPDSLLAGCETLSLIGLQTALLFTCHSVSTAVHNDDDPLLSLKVSFSFCKQHNNGSLVIVWSIGLTIDVSFSQSVRTHTQWKDIVVVQ